MRTSGRWVAVGACTGLVAVSAGMLYLAISLDLEQGDPAFYLPYVALGLLLVTPFVAAALSGAASAFATGAGGVAVGIAATVFGAALDGGGSGILPLTLGIAVGGLIALRATSRASVWTRIVATIVVSVFAVASARIVSLIFVYPLLGFADELADLFAGRRRVRTSPGSPSSPREPAPPPPA